MLNRILSHQGQLSRAEQAVGDWVVSHPHEVVRSTLAEVANRAGTSEPTVVRFCRSVGVAGFSELRLRLAESLSRTEHFLHSDVLPGDATKDAVMKVMERSIQAIMNVRNLAQSMPFEDAVMKLQTARQWVFGGLGASGSVAQDACQKFFRLGTPCTYHADTPGIAQGAAVLGAQDVLLLVSHSGRWIELAQAARSARDRGAFVIALTRPGSVLAREASVLFDCHTVEDTNVYTPMSSRLAHLALLDALQVALALALGEPAEMNLRRSKQALTLR